MKVLSCKDPMFESCDRRVRIERDDSSFWPPDEWDHSFKIWSRTHKLRGDKDAIDPFSEIVYEDHCSMFVPNDGLIVFPVSMLDHSVRVFGLGDSMFIGDPDGWDTTRGALFLYTDKQLWERMHGKETWIGEKDEEFIKLVRKEAEGYVKELNLAESGQVWGYILEHKETWTKTYSDGREIEGFDWVEDDSCWGFLTDDVNDIDFPHDCPVFSDYFEGKEYK